MSAETINGQEVLRLHPAIYRGRLSRRAGWRMLPGGVNCARPGWFGNPFKVGPDGDAQACVDKYGHALWEMRFRDPNGVPAVPSPGVAGMLTAYLAPLVEVHRQHGMVCALDSQCQDLCVYLGLPAGSASGTAKHLNEAIAGLQLQPQR